MDDEVYVFIWLIPKKNKKIDLGNQILSESTWQKTYGCPRDNQKKN